MLKNVRYCGKSCAPCVNNFKCVTNEDCISKVCVDNVCAAPTCSDQIKNQDEAGIDCGGNSGCSLCDSNKECAVNNDCLSSNCNQITKLCEASSCSEHDRHYHYIKYESMNY